LLMLRSMVIHNRAFDENFLKISQTSFDL